MYFEKQGLLTPPVGRAAYSDRTAWIMAEMSRLAYFKFEGSLELADIAASLVKNSDKKKILSTLKELLQSNQQSRSVAEKEFENYIDTGKFKLVKTFSEKGSQAFLALSEEFKMIVLAFRGTEKDIRDIKTDLRAITVEVDGYKIHSGFYAAFENLKNQIEIALKNINRDGYALYITGHSLGGALALLATKYLASDSVGACYTFGSPRVASSQFGDSIKTPIYRIVNSADLVPRVPPAYIPHFLISIFEIFYIPFVSKFIVGILENMLDYRHHGDMRFLTSCKQDFSDLRLIQNPTIIERAMRLFKRLITNWKAGGTDHFVLNYCDKLSAYAETRNKQ